MKIEIIKCLQDNYSYLVIDESNNSACVIDHSESKPLIKFIEKKGINLKFILNTHHHYDHVGGNKELKKKITNKYMALKFFKNNIKETKEHNMIVDMERNDLSRICKPGTVKIKKEKYVEEYRHLYH